jgi:hypothetical protein
MARYSVEPSKRFFHTLGTLEDACFPNEIEEEKQAARMDEGA